MLEKNQEALQGFSLAKEHKSFFSGAGSEKFFLD